MRFDTQNAGHFLVEKLHQCGVVAEVVEDGSDIVLLELVSGHRVMLYLIDSSITPSEIRHNLQENTAKNIYTLYFFWCDLMLPPERQYYAMDDWMKLLVNLHGNKLYGFNVMGRNAEFFPVYFQGQGRRRYINFGDPIDYETLGCLDLRIGRTFWKIAGFMASEQDKVRKRHYLKPTLAPYFDLFGLPYTADVKAVKAAYRKFARLFHPDLNPHRDSSEQMQKINDAYERLMRHLKDD
jgi:hypothetical protein